jgi:hypothetical protein
MFLIWLLGCGEPLPPKQTSPATNQEPWTYGTFGYSTPTSGGGASVSSTDSTSPSGTTASTATRTTTSSTGLSGTTPPLSSTLENPVLCPLYVGFEREGQWQTWRTYDGTVESTREVVEIRTSGAATTVVVEQHSDIELEGLSDYVQDFTWEYLCDAEGMWALGGELEFSYEEDGELVTGWSVSTYEGLLSMPMDLSVGDSWVSHVSYAHHTTGTGWGGDFIQEDVALRAGVVHTEAGRFDAIEVQSSAEESTWSAWMEAGIGFVQNETSEVVAFGG